jgi:uncharacterized damage-inducible protein DinB
MQRPEANEYRAAYQKYFDLIPNGDYIDMLEQNKIETVGFFDSIPPQKHDYRYAEGKWSIKEVLMHIIDTERVFTYRALAAARGDAAPVYRMDEELYAANVDVSDRTTGDLISEFKAVRKATEFLFRNMTDEQSKRFCNVVTHPMSARAIAYFIIGHVLHHVGVVRSRYLQ